MFGVMTGEVQSIKRFYFLSEINSIHTLHFFSRQACKYKGDVSLSLIKAVI